VIGQTTFMIHICCRWPGEQVEGDDKGAGRAGQETDDGHRFESTVQR
jgi:hypothetical protein